ncbi:MAG: c-type cytochrome [Flavobacteriales bacterium]|nr:c-type cytochrome [Flavobacteriales bacterium]
MTAAHAQKDEALYAQGEKLFKGNCAACHKPDKDMTGPALKGAKARWEGKGDIYAWVKNSSAYLATGNSYAKDLFAKWNNSPMTAQALTDAEIDAVLHYVDNYAPPAPPQGGKAPTEAPVEEPSTAWQWLLVLGLLFLVVVLSLGGVKHQLGNAVREVEGKEPLPETGFWGGIKRWAWANKGWASVIGLLLVVFLIVQAWDWAFNIGVYGGDAVEHYKPEQPIKFNHTIHAGKAEKGNLQINCVYCHSSAEKSKHAGIPSANVCMNCHQAVNESQRNPWSTEEIKKIYAATGWDGKAYTGPQQPIQWVKVHNLPDHVAFSHATHVSVGKIECQKCHGPIDEQMDVAEQWSPLTMGWCIQCHNETEVQMAGNGYYDEIHRRLKETPMGNKELRKYLEDEKITVKELGGWECAKCHY